jgi:hypothetical protein
LQPIRYPTGRRSEKIADVSGQSYAGDIGTLYRWNDEITFAAVAANLGPALKIVDAKDPLPTAYRIGAYDQFMQNWNASADVVYRAAGLASVSGGLDWTYRGILTLRGGLDSSRSNGLSILGVISAGVGIHLFGQEFNYAWVPYSDLGNAQYFSLDVHFGGRSSDSDEKPRLRQVRKSWYSSGDDDDDADFKNLKNILSDDEKEKLPK